MREFGLLCLVLVIAYNVCISVATFIFAVSVDGCKPQDSPAQTQLKKPTVADSVSNEEEREEPWQVPPGMVLVKVRADWEYYGPLWPQPNLAVTLLHTVRDNGDKTRTFLLVENAVFMKSEEKTMTLSVPTDDAPKVVLAEGTGTLCVILRRVKNNDEHSIIGKKLLERFEPK